MATEKIDKKEWKRDMKEFWHEVMDLNVIPEKGMARIASKHNLDMNDIVRRYMNLNYGNINWRKQLRKMLSL